MNKKFKLTIIGSGTILPTKMRHPSCYFLEIGKKKILLDLGHTSISHLIDMGIDLCSIDIIFFSHFHTDHFADFLPFVHSRWIYYLNNQKEKVRPLTIIVPNTTQKRWKKLREIFWVEPNEHYPLNFIEGENKIKIDNIEF